MVHLWTWFTYLVRILYNVYGGQQTPNFFIDYMFSDWYRVSLYVGVVPWICVMGSVLVIFGDRSKKCPNHGSRKNRVLVVTDPPPKILIFFSSLYQCGLNCQKIFFAGNPWSVNNVRHFAKNRFSSKFMPQLHIFCTFLHFSWFRRGVHEKVYFFFFYF